MKSQHFGCWTNGANAAVARLVARIIGRINTASEGSVSVGAEFGGNGGPTQDWYTSTRYGALYWTATAMYRTMLYVPAPADLKCR